MTTQKKPIAAGFSPMTNPTGLQRVVNGIGTAMHTALNTPNVRCQIFGLAEPRTHADARRWPSMYNSTLSGDEFNLLPSDMWQSYLFFDREDPIIYDTDEDLRGSARKWGIPHTKVSLIFYGNLKWYGLATKNGADYRIIKEQLRNTLLQTLWKKCTTVGGQITVTSVYDLNIADVFKGYSLNDIENQYLAQPFYGVRIEMDVYYTETCSATLPSLYFSVSPVLYNLDFPGEVIISLIASNTTWAATGDCDTWVTFSIAGEDNDSMTMTVSRNDGLYRTGIITITPVGFPPVTITINQIGKSS